MNAPPNIRVPATREVTLLTLKKKNKNETENVKKKKKWKLVFLSVIIVSLLFSRVVCIVLLCYVSWIWLWLFNRGGNVVTPIVCFSFISVFFLYFFFTAFVAVSSSVTVTVTVIYPSYSVTLLHQVEFVDAKWPSSRPVYGYPLMIFGANFVITTKKLFQVKV